MSEFHGVPYKKNCVYEVSLAQRQKFLHGGRTDDFVSKDPKCDFVDKLAMA